MKSELDYWVHDQWSGHFSERYCLGTRSTYVKGCRCRRCTDANADYLRKYRKKVAQKAWQVPQDV